MPSSRRNAKRRIRESPSEKEFWEFARKHFSEDFPNPTHQGCPPEEAIQFLAKTPLGGDVSVLNHLFRCSPCYQIFYSYAQKMKAQGKKSPSKKLLNRKQALKRFVAEM